MSKSLSFSIGGSCVWDPVEFSFLLRDVSGGERTVAWSPIFTVWAESALPQGLRNRFYERSLSRD